MSEDGARYCMECGKPVPAPTFSIMPAIKAPHAGQPASRTAARQAPPGRPSGAAPARALIPETREAPAAAPTADPAAGPAAPPAPISAPVPRTEPATGAVQQCQWCRAMVNVALPYCPHCGKRTDGALQSVRTLVFSATRSETRIRLVLLDDAGGVRQTWPLTKAEVTIGRGTCDIRSPDDTFLSPMHAQIFLRDGAAWVRDLGARNRTWLYASGDTPLEDGDCLLIGTQIIRYRRIGQPAPTSPGADGTRPAGSASPGADVAVLSQLRADGSVRDTYHLSSGRSIVIGRDTGDWLFPYDHTMSARHAELRDQGGPFILHDVGSRNGTAIAVRGERRLEPGQRLLAGAMMLRLETA